MNENENSHYCFYKSDALPEKNLFGYEKQMRAGKALGLFVAKGGFKTVLAFGYAGTGKSAFPLALARELNSNFRLNFNFARIQCSRIAMETQSAYEVDTGLSRLAEKIEHNLPAIVAMDEIDVLTPSPKLSNPSALVLLRWVISLIDRQPGNVLIFGISNAPQCLDKNLSRRLCVPLYFDVTSADTVAEIIKHYFGPDRYKKIASELTSQLEALDLNPISAEIIQSCFELKRAGKNLAELSDEEAVSTIRRNLTPCSSGRLIKQYKDENKSLIEFSEKYAIPYWSQTLEEKQQAVAVQS
jgi:SpoVK/Ycf46/Vps4 family AAA+-type ATPase